MLSSRAPVTARRRAAPAGAPVPRALPGVLLAALLAGLVAACTLLLGAAASGATAHAGMAGMPGMPGMPGMAGSGGMSVTGALAGPSSGLTADTASRGGADSSAPGTEHACDAPCAAAAGGWCLLVVGLVVLAARGGPATAGRLLRRVAALRAEFAAPPLPRGRPPWAAPDLVAWAVDRR